MVPLPGSVIAAKFRLERPLAQGGMGSVWVAFNTQLEVPVALKFMAPALVSSAELVSRFEREAKAAAQLRNPHVVQIFEHGVDQGLPFIAMELLEGEDLGARLRARGRLSLQETARILGDVCKALRRAHDLGLVHRDLKPANIFLCAHDEYEIVKVLDFGIAKSVGASAQGEATKSGSLVGSPHYMSPEQARRTNKQVDHRADLWAVGVIAFRCVTGHLPFPGDDLIDVLVRVCTEAPPVPSSIAPDLGAEVDRFFVRALARDPEGRFQSAKEMADALVALAGSPGRAALPSLERSWSDVHAPPPRPSDRGAANTPPGWSGGPSSAGGAARNVATAGGEQDAFDVAKTLPLAHPAAQRAIGGQPWAAAAQVPAGATPVSPAGVAVGRDPGTTAELPPTQGGFAPPPAIAAPAVAPTLQGTLTSAGTQITPTPAPGPGPARERSWIVIAAVAAVLVVGLVIGGTLLAGAPSDGVSGEAVSQGEGSGSAPAGAQAAASAPAAASSEAAVSASSEAAPSASGEAAPSAAPALAVTAGGASSDDGPADPAGGPSATSATPPVSPTATAAPAPTGTTGASRGAAPAGTPTRKGTLPPTKVLSDPTF